MRREKWLTISRSSLGELRKGNYKNINWYTSSVPDQINNYDMWNIELVVMPYFNNEYGEGILLYNAPREARFFRTPMLIPDFLLSLDREKTINTIIANNETLNLCEMVKTKYDRDLVMQSFHEQELIPERVLEKDLYIKSLFRYTVAIYDEEEAFYTHRKKGCTVTLVECPVVHELLDNKTWSPVPKDKFLEYHNSKFPDTYISTFTPYKYYDETSDDSRMNKKDAKLIADVFEQIDIIRASER